MTATLPDGMEYKDMVQACTDAVSTGVWGSEHPEVDGVRNHIVAVTGVRDEVGDIIVPGAFIKTLQRLTPKACMGHDWNRAIGEPEVIEELMPGDPRLPKLDRFDRPWPKKAGALFARTRYNLAKKDGQDAYADAQFHGPRLACSIGYVDPKDEQTGKPLHSYKAVDPDTGLMTRFLPELHLFEYSQVLHGAHLLAGGLKTGKPTRLERKRARPSMEIKATVRLVRDSAYWGLPLGTPIRAGMKPQGPKARRLVAAGQQADTGAGAVEVDANNLRIKPTAKGKRKGDAAIDTAYSEILGLQAELGNSNPNLDSDDPIDPFNDSTFVVVDENSINGGEFFNPLDILVANAVPPADVEEQLRNNSDWDTSRLGDAAERQDEIDSYVADVVDAYREKYNAELVRQNDTGDGEVADPDAAEIVPDAETAPEAVAPEGVRVGDLKPGSTFVNEENGLTVTVELAEDSIKNPGYRVVQGTDSEGEVYDAVIKNDVTLPSSPAAPDAQAPAVTGTAPAEEPVAMPRGFDGTGKPQPGYAIPPPPADLDMPQAAGQPVPDASEPRLALHNGDPVSVRENDGTTANVYNMRTEQAYDIPAGELLTGGASADAPIMLKLNDAQREAADLVFGNGEPIEDSGAELTGAGLTIADIAEAVNTIDTRMEIFEDNPDQKRRHGRVIKALRAKIAKLGKPGEPIQPDATAPEVLPDNAAAVQPSTEVAPEEVPGQSTVDPMAAPEQPVAPSDADITRMVTAKPDAAAAQAAQMSDDELAAYDAAMSDRAAELGKPGQRTPGHQAIADELARRAEAGPAQSPAEDMVSGPLGETDPALAEGEMPAADGELVEDVDQAQEEAIEQDVTEEITSDELADAEEIVDASFGVTEAPDGEFEVDDDIADRQDRVATLLKQADTGGLDFSGAADDQLRVTRADIVDELRLQEHLERRRTGEQAVTRQQAETQATDDLIPQEEADEQPVDTGPKPRPGVAGAAEDLADALDDGDQARIDAATDRLRKSVNRSRSDSAVVAEIRALLDAPSTEADPITGEPLPGRPDPAALRDAAERLRDEQRAKRNEGARRRRTARRFERERLRSLLGQVEAEMRNRNLDYDPLPDADGNVTLDLNTTPAVAWTSAVEKEGWSGFETRVDDLSGANYSARIVVDVSPQITTRRPPEYRWTVTGDDGTVLATAKGTAPDMDSARTSIEIALDTQRRLGLIPIDAQIPQGHVPEDTSATPLGNVVDAIAQMRQRLADGRTLNPVTGRPDPLGDTLTPLPVPAASLFDDAGAVQKYLSVNGATHTTGNGQKVSVTDLYRWDTAKMTPGGAFVVVDDLQGKPQAVHTVTGATFNPYLPNVKTALNRVDLFRYATIAESTVDRDGKPIDWSQDGKALMADMNSRSFVADGDGRGGRGLQEIAINRLTREKIHAGQFTHKLVLASDPHIHDVTNPTRKKHVEDMRRTLGQLINSRAGKPSAADRKTLEAASAANTLAALGAPDAAAVLLTRRSAELRDEFGDDAPSHGASVLDAMARGTLGMFSPVRSHGERVGALKVGERLFLEELSGDGEEPQLRSFRALGAVRNDGSWGPTAGIAPVIDEKTGDQMFLHIGINEFSITSGAERTFGANPLSADRSSGTFAVVGPGEEPPATVEDLKTRAFDDTAVVPQDVLDAAAEALPESGGETAARRATPGAGVRPPRQGTPRAPRRTAQAPAAPAPVRNEQQLAEAQGRSLGAFLGMPFEYGGPPEKGSFESVEAAREYLAAHLTDEQWKENYQRARSSSAVVHEIDNGEMQLSPSGVFLVRKNGSVSHIGSGHRIWPPSPQSKEAFAEFVAGGGVANQAAGMRVARALESGVFDGEQIDWSGDGTAGVRQTNVISKRNNSFHPLITAQRAAYLDGSVDAAKPRLTDVHMLRGMARDVEAGAPNPEALSGMGVIEKLNTYEHAGGTGTGNFTSGMLSAVADSKAGSTLAKRVALEIRIAEAAATTAPLDVVRRLTRVAGELDGKTITRVNARGDGDQSTPEPLTPSDDLRAIASKITDAFDPNKISESGRFRAANMVGQVEFSKPRITSGQTWQDLRGAAAHELEKRISDAGGIRFYRDKNGMLHGTFAGIDIADGPHNGKTFDGDSIALSGAIKLYPDGTLNLSYTHGSRLVIVEGAPGDWKFTPEETTADGDIETDISGPETESVQVDPGEGVDVSEDMSEIDELATEDEE